MKMDEVLSFIGDYTVKNGYSPSIREICFATGIKSTATCHYYLKKLVESGEITKTDCKKRTLSVSKDKAEYITVPLIGTVTAGTPIFAYENLEEYCPLPAEFGDGDDLFMLRVKGESMVDAGIFNGDKVIVKKQNVAENGEIVVAYFDDGATVKRFYKKDGKIILHPENKTMSDIVLDDASILGVVIGLIRKY